MRLIKQWMSRPMPPHRTRQDFRYAGSGVAALIVLAGLVAFCPPIAAAQLSTGPARIATMSGRVSVERGGELWAVSDGQNIDAGQVIVTGSDGAAQLALPDGSTLEIFPNSRIIFRSNQFNLRDLLDVYLGKVRLQIQHILPGETPLRVTSPTAVISVRGTVFEVEVDAANGTTVSVDSGAVSVRHRLIPGQEVLVQSGQSLHVVPTLPLTASTKPVNPLRTLGRVVQVVTDTLAQINAAKGSSGSSPGASTPGATGTRSGGTISASDSGSNDPAPPPGQDNGDGSSGNSGGNSGGGSSGGSSGGSGGGSSAPPGDVVP
jgi:FecR-like protein